MHVRTFESRKSVEEDGWSEENQGSLKQWALAGERVLIAA